MQTPHTWRYIPSSEGYFESYSVLRGELVIGRLCKLTNLQERWGFIPENKYGVSPLSTTDLGYVISLWSKLDEQGDLRHAE